MTVRRMTVAACAAFAAIASLVSAALASPWGVAPGEFYSELSGSLFSAGSHYDDDENRVIDDGLFEQRTLSSYSEIGWKKHWSLRLGLPVVSRTVRPNALPAPATSTGFGNLLFGVKQTGHFGATPISLSLTWTAPGGTNPLFSPGTSVSPGTGADGATGELLQQGLQSMQADLAIGGTAGSRSYWSLQGGYRYRYSTIGGRTKSAVVPDTLMSERRWQDAVIGEAEMGVWFSRSLLVSGAFHGEFPIDQGDLYDGSFAANPGKNGPEFETVRMLAGPRVTYRVDDRLDAFAGSWHSPGGRNVLHVDQYYAGIAWKSTKLDRLAGLLGNRKPH